MVSIEFLDEEREVDAYSVDFAALRVLRLVHAHGSFTRAAEALDTTQSAVSYTIERLRRAFDDPLFVRQGAGIVATDRCDEIVAEAARMLDRFAALSAPRGFDPGQAEAAVTISCNHYERVTVVPWLMRALRARAPGLRLHIISSTVRGKEQLSRGESDLLIGPIRIEDAGFFRRRLMEDIYVCVMDPANRLAQGALDAARFMAAPQAVVTYGGNWRSSWLVEMEQAGAAPNMVAEVPSPANLPQLLAGTDLIATVPARVARGFGPGLAMCECPFPAPFGIDLYWTARTHEAPMHKWLRGLIAQAATEL